jgi:hypothetical protein
MVRTKSVYLTISLLYATDNFFSILEVGIISNRKGHELSSSNF